MTAKASRACPCGSGRALAACCRPRLDGSRPAETAEALMRSRYTAYVQHDAPYLLRTWHPDTRPVSLDFAGDAAHWLGLEVRARSGGGPADVAGSVEFVARYKLGGRAYRLHERSRFEKRDGAWVYVDGEFPVTRQ